MQELAQLAAVLKRLDGRGYPAYKQIRGAYQGPDFTLHVDHVQGDPFAEPSRCRVVMSHSGTVLPSWAWGSADARRATADFANRRMADALARLDSSSGPLRMQRPGQKVLQRSSARVTSDGGLEVRFSVGLPARGRRILGWRACELMTEVLVKAMDAGMRVAAWDVEALRRHVRTVEDAQALRSQLEDLGLVAFVADGSILPRRTGVDDRPLQGDGVVPFWAPASMRVALRTPHSGTVEGMGLPCGVTLIVGGGYHGKSTLLRALEAGVYDHVPADGRERVVALAHATKVRAEDGRAVVGTDISGFIDGLPDRRSTRRFCTENASGSTSQAATIAEALESDCGCLLLDEDTSATNFMIRDARMQALVEKEAEPITPFIDRVRALSSMNVSSVIVVGGAGDYLDVADQVIAMRDYVPRDATEKARDVALRFPSQRASEGHSLAFPTERVLAVSGLDTGRGRKDVSIKVRAKDRLTIGQQDVDLGALEQLAERGQTRALAWALAWLRRHFGASEGCCTPQEAAAAVMAQLETKGLDGLSGDRLFGDLCAFRPQELIACLSRVRSLRLAAVPEEQ